MGQNFPYSPFSLEEHNCQQEYSKICFHIPHALFLSLSAARRYHSAIAWTFLKLNRSNFLKHLLVLIFGVDLGRLIFPFFFYLHTRDNDHLSKSQIPHYGKLFEDHLLETSQLCNVCLKLRV